MAKKLKIKEDKTSSSSALIKTSPLESNVIFSFRYLDSSKAKFKYHGRRIAYYEKVLERLKSISQSLLRELQFPKNPKALRVHSIKWEETTEKNGFSTSLPLDLRESEPFQFSVSGNEHGRCHGFFIGNTFHVVWLDPDHLLYP